MTDAATNPPSPEGNPPRRKAEPTGGDAPNSAGGSASGGGGKPRTFQAPKGTRDFYPHDLLRRRYIIDTWRRVSLRHGFEEIDGPTFEDSALYTVKSGEGILNELFGAYSGKDPKDTKQVQEGGPPPFALRPEFTPTLARMYAARAKQLPQPTKWFCVSNFFRAERPQRGRLREFWQWNADFIGSVEPALQAADAETLALLVNAQSELGLGLAASKIRVSDRNAFAAFMVRMRIDEGRHAEVLAFVDKRAKLSPEQFKQQAEALHLPPGFTAVIAAEGGVRTWLHPAKLKEAIESSASMPEMGPPLLPLSEQVDLWGLVDVDNDKSWLEIDTSLARGLAYYTGTVFELIAEGERAVAGGGRYDKLIELFGGPPTPAVGFGMGDVVLTNLLDDRKLMPEGKDLLEATSRPLPTRPDVFVIANEAEDSQAKLVPLVASLRRGVETDKYKQGDCKPWSTDRYSPTLGGTPPLHARRSYKATKNIGKLLSEATACHARYALIIENAETGTLKNMDTGEQTKDVPLDKVGGLVAQG
jgi:histidyl-tRNA synthetase